MPLYDLKLIENIRLKPLVCREARAGHLLLHARVVLLGFPVLVAADRVAAQVAEAGVEVGFGFFGALAVGLE